MFLILAILGILFFDHDDYDAENGEVFHPEGHHNGIIRHTFYHFLSWSGLSDHKVCTYIHICIIFDTTLALSLWSVTSVYCFDTSF